MKEFWIQTNQKYQVINITSQVEELVKDVKEGAVLVFLPHATAGLILNEDEEGLKQDFLKKFLDLVPPHENYLHNRIDDNAHSHILSALTKQFAVLPVKNGKLVRGTWQEILLLEWDGPRERRVIVKIL